jgi:predicted phage terminase large subunit-like protein
MFPREVVDRIKGELGSAGFAGQHQQSPSPAEGGMFKKHWWRFWQPRGANLKPVPVKMPDGTIQMRDAIIVPDNFGTVVQGWDMAFKDTKTSDFTAGLVVGAVGADRYILDCEHGRMDLPEVLNAVRRLSMRWPNAHLKLVEDKANGPAVIQSLRHEIGGLVEVNPQGGKVARANAAAPSVESGNWYVPHPDLAPWVRTLIDEAAAFPTGAHDDICDAMSMIALRLLYVTPRGPAKKQYQAHIPTGDRIWMS